MTTENKTIDEINTEVLSALIEAVEIMGDWGDLDDYPDWGKRCLAAIETAQNREKGK